MAKKFNILLYGGVYIIQTGDINLALTEDRAAAIEAQKQYLGEQATETPYVYEYVIKYEDESDMANDILELYDLLGPNCFCLFNLQSGSDGTGIARIRGIVI